MLEALLFSAIMYLTVGTILSLVMSVLMYITHGPSFNFLQVLAIILLWPTVAITFYEIANGDIDINDID